MGTVTKVKKGQVLDYKYTGGVQSVTLPVGTYKLEVWGAEGGMALNNYGGYGGYSVGILTLTDESTVLYIQVGGRPASVGDDRVVVPGGYNGGGNGYNRYYNDTATYGQGGGGGTDIRIGQDSLYARVIVAGGGGGSSSNGDEGAKKYGGGLDGGCEASTYQAHQTPSTGSTNVNFGTFGQGGAATTEGGNYKYGSGGGGGGWYGGAASNRYSDSETTLRTYNGGGSGYVYTADTATNYPSGCLLNSSYYLAEAQTIAGNTSFPSPNGGTEIGHSGNGYARITVLAVESSISASVKVGGQWRQANEMFVKVNGVWKECIEAWVKVNGVWKSLAESAPSTPTTYTITLGANVGKITANGKIPQQDKLSYHVSKGDTIVVTSTIFNANSHTMVFSHIPANVSFSKKTNNGTGTRATTSVTFTMPASDLTVSFTLKSGAGA